MMQQYGNFEIHRAVDCVGISATPKTHLQPELFREHCLVQSAKN